MISMFAALALVFVATAPPGSFVRGESMTLQVHGSGTTNPSKCFWAIQDLLTVQSRLPVHFSYRAVGSSTGHEEFLHSTAPTDYSSSDFPLDSAQYQELASGGHDVVQLPVLLGAVSFFHSIPFEVDVDPKPPVKLSACLLARIFKREIKQWDHPDILDLNPGVPIPSMAITVAHRVKGSSSTMSTTQYMGSVCPDVWPAEMMGAKIPWPEDTQPCQGSGGMATCLKEIPGAIGYIDSGHGHHEGLQEIWLQNPSGRWVDSRTASQNGGIASAAENEGVLPATAADDFGDNRALRLLNQDGPWTWPIVLMTYVLVKQDLTSLGLTSNEQGLLIAFLRATYDDVYVQKCADEYGFTLPNANVREFGLKGIRTLEQANPSAANFTFEYKKKTVAVDGAGDYVLSGKRQSIADVEREKNAEAAIEALGSVSVMQSRLSEALEQLSTLKEQMEPVQQNVAAASASAQSGDFTEQDQQQLTAALVLSSLSFIFWMICLSCFGVRWCLQKR